MKRKSNLHKPVVLKQLMREIIKYAKENRTIKFIIAF